MLGYIKDRLLIIVAGILMILLPIIGFQVVGILGNRAALAGLLMVILIIFNWIDNILLKSENQSLQSRLTRIEEKLGILTGSNQPLPLDRTKNHDNLQQRLNQLEERLGTFMASASAELPYPPRANSGNQQIFNVILQEFPSDRKIAILKEVRSITGLGLREAKDLIESTPAFVKVGLSRSEAEKIQQQLADAGAIVLIANH